VVSGGASIVGLALDETLSLAEALDVLPSPYALERFSPLTGAAALVVDFTDATLEPVPDRLAGLRSALEQLACPTLAICPEETPATVALADRFDVVLLAAEEAAPLLETVRRFPIASLALVQLLRQGDVLDLHHALIAESLVYSTLQSGPEFGAWLAGAEKPVSAPDQAGPAVRVERWDAQLVLSLNRARRHNAFSMEMRDGLVEGLQMAVADTSIAEVVLRGEGPSFCSGGDLSEFGDLPDPATAHAVRSTRNPGRLLTRCADRVIARVHGACIGAGVELPAFAARVEADAGAFFQLPELRMGLVPGAGGTASLPRRIGRHRTAWLALSGERVDPETALRWGLVDAIVERDPNAASRGQSDG
jgi:enoyl-CoA hydratase